MGMETGSPLSRISIPPAQYATLLVIEWGSLAGSGPRFSKIPGPQNSQKPIQQNSISPEGTHSPQILSF